MKTNCGREVEKSLNAITPEGGDGGPEGKVVNPEVPNVRSLAFEEGFAVLRVQ